MAERPLFWPAFRDAVLTYLDQDDDPSLWERVVNTVYAAAADLSRAILGRDRVRTVLGRSSHWLRPHQTRWTADEGYAWPVGYHGLPSSRDSAPEFDWVVEGRWSPASASWEIVPVRDPQRTKTLTFRVSVPCQTTQHEKVAAHTMWTPGSPPRPTSEYRQLYGFRRRGAGFWECTAYEHSRDNTVLVCDPDEGVSLDELL
jgi:hypothetical protein